MNPDLRPESLYSANTRYLTVFGYLFLLPVLVVWVLWFFFILTESSLREGIESFNEIFPENMIGMPVNYWLVLFSFIALVLGILRKLSSGRKWYKTTSYVQILILGSCFLFFLTILRMIY